MESKKISRPTMREVAFTSGTSLKTVSRVFNDVPSVDPELKEKVLRAAKKLNYIPNMTAGSLRRSNGKTNTIGILLEDISNPFSSALYRIYEDFAAENGYVILAGSLDEDATREHDLVNLFISRRVDGLLIAPSGKDHAHLKREVQSGVHFGFVDRPPVNFEADVVLSTNLTGALDAVKHLISYGHKRIAFLGDDPAIYTAQERFAGYCKALKSAKITLDKDLIFKGIKSEAIAIQQIRKLLQSSAAPTAFFASQNLLTLVVLKALKAEGLEKSIAVVGFDDIPAAELLTPGVTHVKQDIAEIGRRSIEMLFARINGNASAYRTEIVPTFLIPMGSGEIKPLIN
jgi:LacI family transcriptional regulator